MNVSHFTSGIKVSWFKSCLFFINISVGLCRHVQQQFLHPSVVGISGSNFDIRVFVDNVIEVADVDTTAASDSAENK